MNKHYGSDCQASVEKKVEGEVEAEELIFSAEELATLQAKLTEDNATRTMAMQWLRATRGAGADVPQAFRVLPESPAMVAANAASHKAIGRPTYYPMWRRGCLSDPTFLGELRDLNARGYGIFSSTNYIRLEGQDDAYKGKDGRRAVVPQGTPLCLVTDIDHGAPLRDLDTIPCTLQVQSSTPGKLHHYLRCAPGTTHAQWCKMQWALVAYLGGDPAVTDLSRAIRVPGFLHNKKSPILSTVLRSDLDVEISFKEFKAFLDGVGAGYLLQLGEAEISRRYRPLYSGRVAGLISDADLMDLSSDDAVELGKRVSAFQQAVSAADKFRAKNKSWAGLVPKLDFASGSPEAWGTLTTACNGAERAMYMAGLQDRIRKHNSFLPDPDKHIAEPYPDGRWLSPAAEAVLKGEMVGVALPEGTHPLLALLFSARPYASTVLGWSRQAWGEYQAGRAVPQFDVGQIYSSEGWAADTSEDFGEDWSITLASGNVLTLAQIRDGALGTDEFVSAFCPWHQNTSTPAATVRAGKNGQVICHCHGGCEPASRRSGRLIPLALRSAKKADLQGVEWVGEGSFEGGVVAAQKPEVSRYLSPIVRLPATKLIAIHSPTGSGKTYSMMELIEGGDKVIYVTPTQALSYSGAALIGGVSHLDQPGGTITAPRVATTIDSLWRVEVSGEIEFNEDGTTSNFGWGGVLILDEWDQIEQRLFLDPRISRKAAEVRGVLQRAIAGADLVIIASAHLDAGHLSRFVEMGAYTPEMVQVECLPEGAPEAHTGRPMTFFGAMGQAIERVVELLGDGEKVAVPCTEKQFAESLGAHLAQLYPDKRGIVIHGEGSPEDIKTLRDVEQGWASADYVIYNGKCGSGVSFSAPDTYHTVMVAHDVLGIGANALLQLAHRIRHPKSWSAWVGASARSEGDRSTYTAEEIVQGKVAEAARLAYLQNRYIIRDPETGAAYCVGAGDDPVCRHGAAVQAAHMLACLDPRGDMIRELRRQGAVLLSVAAPDEGTDEALDLVALSDLFKNLRRQIRDGKVIAALSSAPLSQDELIKAKKAQTTTPEERAQQAAATVLNRYGKAGIEGGYINPELIDDALRHSNTWTSRQRLALLCIGLAGREDVLVRREVRNGVAGGAWALDGSSTRILTWRKLLTALGGSGGVTIETTEQDLDVSYVSEDEHSLPTDPVTEDAEGVRVLKTFRAPETLNTTPSKVTLDLQIQTTWTAQTVAASDIPALLRQLTKGIPKVSLGGSLAADIKHGRYLPALNRLLRAAGIPVISKMRGSDRVMHCSVDQDALATALQQAERYALGLLGGVPAPIETFDPRLVRLEESADVEDFLASYDASSTPTATATPTPAKKPTPHPLDGIEEALLAAKKAAATLRVSYAKDNPYAPSGTWTPPAEELWEVIVEAFGA